MRIHSDVITTANLFEAAHLARVDLVDYKQHGSRSRTRAFNVKLEGESRRRPNGGSSATYGESGGSGYAATWDQWGVFLGYLFEIDPRMVTPYYSNKRDFDHKTGSRFRVRGTWTDGDKRGTTHWPRDAHGDHTFRFAGVPFEQSCTKCSAVQRWSR